MVYSMFLSIMGTRTLQNSVYRIKGGGGVAREELDLTPRAMNFGATFGED